MTRFSLEIIVKIEFSIFFTVSPRTQLHEKWKKYATWTNDTFRLTNMTTAPTKLRLMDVRAIQKSFSSCCWQEIPNGILFELICRKRLHLTNCGSQCIQVVKILFFDSTSKFYPRCHFLLYIDCVELFLNFVYVR